jgi:ABC-type branched-chain amino acid transport system, permease component
VVEAFRREAGNSLAALAAIIIVLGAAYPILRFIAPGYAIYLTYGVIWSIAALGFNILYGYTGLLSFGHAAFIGIGAYTVGLTIKYLGLKELEVMLLVAMAASAILALIVGPVVLRYGGIFFAIFMLAVGQILWGFYLKFYHVTGGTDGIKIGRVELLGFELGGVDYLTYLTIYHYYVLAIAAVAYITMWYIVNSPLGYSLKAIRDNEVRAIALGINTLQLKLVAFTISAVYTGLAGALLAPLTRLVSPELAYWFVSGKIVFMTILGGASYLVGPIVGAIIYTYLESIAMGYTIYWYLLLGILIIAVMILSPKGLMYLVDSVAARSRLRWGAWSRSS